MNTPKSYPVEKMDAFLRHAERGDVAGMEVLVEQGLDLTLADAFGESVLTRLIGYLQDQPRAHVLVMVKQAVRLGADPRQLDSDRDDGFGPLVQAMLYADTNLLRYLLEGGADPNALREMDRPSSLYDWAWADYQLEVWDVNEVPEVPSEADKATEECWIAFFDRLALKHGKQRPNHIAVLREHGALTAKEMQVAGTQ